ncbi:pre-mRNA-splicing factor 38B-like [Pecten maximus]|uniref:pre-mRNA-splicing factor 38B-like n=1 Tax=Pecten maximus TaxID=6579 RepID=UPI001458BAF2|nr:pre-mRNA-splicing factor 38B-like [Pecten maximus]XP_033732795.1 pre-mRNA-splicing factor 38B-like [Pecten maximus]
MAPNNPLPIWGNEKTMNMNPLILTNIQSSPYFKVNLYELKTYHEVIDEIYYRVEHLEPWERGSRKTAGQTGMCGGVRGVGAGGIVSSAYCLLYKLFTLRLTRKQLTGLITHQDSPFIRGLGFMYIRYTQDPKELWDWYEPYLEDEEEIDVKAGGGHVMPIGEMIRQWMTKLEWYSTLFPRIPVPVQKDLMQKLKNHQWSRPEPEEQEVVATTQPQHIPDEELSFGEAERMSYRRRSPDKGTSSPQQSRRSPRRSPVRRSPHRRSPDRRRSPHHRSPPDHRRHSPDHHRSRGRRPSPSRRSAQSSGGDFARDLQRERDRQKRTKDRDSQPRSRERKRSHSRERHLKKSSKHSHRDRRSRSRSKERHRDRHGREKHRNGDH